METWYRNEKGLIVTIYFLFTNYLLVSMLTTGNSSSPSISLRGSVGPTGLLRVNSTGISPSLGLSFCSSRIQLSKESLLELPVAHTAKMVPSSCWCTTWRQIFYLIEWTIVQSRNVDGGSYSEFPHQLFCLS